jgi:signal transduction histidine kinase
MKNLRKFLATRAEWFSSCGREQRVKDYIDLSNQLVWKRQGSFFAAAALAAFYFDPYSIFASYLIVVLTEVLDIRLGRQSKAWDGQDPITGQRILKRIAFNTTASAVAINFFVINIALQQSSTGHFTPLFFLFSASVFAAMYNSQMKGILLLRLSIYSFAFLYIALLDVFRHFPPLSSEIWLEFFTIIFVLYFIADIAVKFYQDYHERLAKMILIKKENERTKAALEVKSQFLSTVSHELRTPLTSIIGSLELMKSERLVALPDNLKPLLRIAAKNGQRLASLVEDLLDLQKFEAGEIALNFDRIDANALVDEAVESTAGYASKLEIAVIAERYREDCFIAGDRKRLIQVMSNLLSNALKFSDDGGAVKVKVEALGSRIRISVNDEGVGIPEGSRDNVFGKFSQVDSSDIRKVGGTGLGLHIAKRIIERHKGIIDYESELGVGSTFYIELDRLRDIGEMIADLDPLGKAA